MSDQTDPAAVLANLSGNEGAAETVSTGTPEAGKWVDQLSKEYRTDESLKGKAKLDDLFKDYKDRGTKLAELETKVKTFESPKDAKEYELPKDVVEKLKLSDDVQAFYKESFLKSGLSKDQAAKVFGELTQRSLSMIQAQQEARAKAEAQAEAEIQKDWGKDFAGNMDTVRTAVSKLFPAETVKRMESVGLFKDKGFLNGLLPVGRSVSEGKFIKGGSSEEAKDPFAALYPSMVKKSS